VTHEARATRGFAGEIAALFRASGYAVSPNPDLPNAMLGPDLLVAKQGELLAFFDPKVRERRHEYELLVRLILSRFALPDHVRTVLVLDHSFAANKAVDNLRIHFHLVVTRGIKPSAIIEQARAAPDRKIPPGVRRHVQLQAAVLLTPDIGTTPKRARADAPEPGVSSEVGLQSLGWRPVDRLPMTLRQLPGLEIRSHTVVATPPPSSRSDRPRQEFLRYLPIVPLLAYAIDNGVPYPTRSIIGLFRPSGHISETKLSALSRPAANAGWRFMTDSDGVPMADLELRLATWARNHPYERP
jgi:hypothetical protein